MTGSLTAPQVAPDASAAARIGAAAALSAVITPLPGAVAFLDLGSSEDSGCQALLQQAESE